MSSAVDQSKQSVRETVVTRRRTRSAVEHQRDSQALAHHATALPAFLRARRVAAYVSMPTEPGTGPLLAWLVARGVPVIVPVSLADHTLDWVAYAPGELAVGPLGVPEPTGPRLGRTALDGCDLALVPALAVDHAGNRLGRGAGYYDRALAGFAGLVCAIVFADELLPTLPHEPHDRPVDLVLTPAGLFRPSRG